MDTFVIRVISIRSGVTMHEIYNVTRVTEISDSEIRFEKVGFAGSCKLSRYERVEVDRVPYVNEEVRREFQ